MSQNKLQDLIALNQEPSSAKRRELLREVTNLFFAVPEGPNPSEMALFDTVLCALTEEMEEAVRADLAERFADLTAPPKRLVRSLAADVLAVSEPILSRSPALSEADLLALAKNRGQGHLKAISGRTDLTTGICDTLVERGDDNTLGVLLGNASAPLSRHASESVVGRAVDNRALHEAVVDRHDLPADLLNEMYFIVEARLRQRILEKNSNLDPVLLNAALESSRTRLATRDGALPADYPKAETRVKDMRSRGQITPQALAALLRNGERTAFLLALSELGDIDFHTTRRIVERRDVDALAVICRAVDLDRALFLTLAVLILEPGQAMARAKEYGALFNDLSKDTALRTMRFWRMRRTTGDVAA